MGLLSQSQKDAFWNDGVLVVEDAVSDCLLYTSDAADDC